MKKFPEEICLELKESAKMVAIPPVFVWQPEKKDAWKAEADPSAPSEVFVKNILCSEIKSLNVRFDFFK